MSAKTIDVARLFRLATLLFAILAASLVYFSYEPQVAAAQLRLDDAQTTLLSQDVAFDAMSHLRLERSALASRYDTPFVKNPEAVFLRELAATVRRHGVTLISTSVVQDDGAGTDATHRALFEKTRVSLELHGSYAHLLAAIHDLSNGSAIVGVDAPTLRRDVSSLVASVPITIYEPFEGVAP